jgi:hypothetical protein
MNEKPLNTGVIAGSNTFWGMVCCICVCATIVLVVYRFNPGEPPSRRLWTPDLVETNGTVTVMGESRQLEFWTPSSKTKDYLHKEKGQVVATEMWEVMSNEAPVEQFGEMLHNDSWAILGYRRVEVWGQGRTMFKPGWWWTVNVSTNYTASDLAKVYETFWQSHQLVFIEVIDNRGVDGNK